MSKRPNILFAFADDWGRYAGAYAQFADESPWNRQIQTPAFDRIAREGAVFRNAVVPAPSCTPCRSSILSGRYFWQTGMGAILQGALWDDSIPSYPLMLEEKGYHIGYTYKVWGPGNPPHAPYGKERTKYESAGSYFGRFSHRATDRAREVGLEAAKQELYDEVLANFQSFLDTRPDDKPFCYWWGPTNTHRSWERGSGKALWGLDPDALKASMPSFLPDVQEVREDVADYLGECMAFDAGLSVILQHLEEIGELDDTLIVVSGDHGIPGMPRGKCNLYDIGCEVALAARWPGHIRPGRVIDDLINIMDLGPTFLEAAGESPHPEMTARSLLPILESEQSGQVDPERTWAVMGRERHVAAAREGFLPYPQRSIRTHDHLYILNFEPDRWPMGDPRGLDDPETIPPPYEEIAKNTFVAYADLDASPTKAWMIHHRSEEDQRKRYEIGFGKRPREELFDLKRDPDCVQNVADDPEYREIQRDLRDRLLTVLREQDDPRVTEAECRFDLPPFTEEFKR